MSRFLGPIHYSLFSKIRFQDDFCKILMEKIKEKNISLYNLILEETYSIPDLDLSEIIDTDNIHGSLQEMIGEVEYKLVYVVDLIEKNNLFSFDEILFFAREYGKSLEIEKDIDLVSSYNLISSKLLNGMPCDRVQEILSNDENGISWIDRVDIHKVFWDNFDRSSRDFYLIRSAILEGIFENTNVEFVEVEELKYVLRSK